MKRILLLIFICIIITSCNPNSNNNHINDKVIQEKTIYYGDYQLDPEDKFSDIIKNNPIDKDYDMESDTFQSSSEFSTGGWVQLEDKYYSIWKQELNEIMKKLKSKLTKDDYEQLEFSQVSWMAYHTKENDFVWEVFIRKEHFGSQGLVSSATVSTHRIRERVIQLMEYYYELNDYKLEFDYKGKR